ncbi:hypothetical protein GW17_00023265 [Ensete ventricosum]|nr:hypothetical protein GW17_00023265 [Ensete ventricosum]
MDLVHGALKQIISLNVILINEQPVQDACLSPTRVAKEFYHAARDALLLYRAVIPIKVFMLATLCLFLKLGKKLESISQVAIIIHNECQYLYQENLGLAFEVCVNLHSAILFFILF